MIEPSNGRVPPAARSFDRSLRAACRRRDSDIEPNPGRPDLPVVAIPADDDARRFEAVEHLLDESRNAVLELGHEIELATEKIQEAPYCRWPLLRNATLTFG